MTMEDHVDGFGSSAPHLAKVPPPKSMSLSSTTSPSWSSLSEGKSMSLSSTPSPSRSSLSESKEVLVKSWVSVVEAMEHEQHVIYNDCTANRKTPRDKVPN